MRKKIIVSALVIVIVVAISVILIINNNSNKNIREDLTESTKLFTTEIITTAKGTTTTEIETTQTITTTEEQTTIKSNYSSNGSSNSENKTENPTKNTTNSTTKAQTTKATTTIEETVDPKMYDASRFPVGYTVTSNPHGTDLAGAYWVSARGKYIWCKNSNGSCDVCSLVQNSTEGRWHGSNWTCGYTNTSSDKKILQSKIVEQEPTWSGEYEGQEYNFTIWVWLPY